MLEEPIQLSYGGEDSRGFGRMNWRYTITWRTSLDDPNPQRGHFHLGHERHFDEPLQRFKIQYEEHMAGMADSIRQDTNLMSIIQLGSEDQQA